MNFSRSKAIFVLFTLIFFNTAVAQINVFIFFFPDCPICQYYAPILHQYADTYESQLCNFHYVIPSKYLSKKEKRNYKSICKKKFNNKNEYIYTENTDSIRKIFNARVTPEVFVVGMNNQVIYSGLIDDKYINVSTHQQKTASFYLKNAIVAALENSSPAISRTEPVGCIISD